jgi:hypothetical protein
LRYKEQISHILLTTTIIIVTIIIIILISNLDNLIRKFSKRYLFIFNDVLLLTSKKESSEFYEVKQVNHDDGDCDDEDYD